MFSGFCVRQFSNLPAASHEKNIDAITAKQTKTVTSLETYSELTPADIVDLISGMLLADRVKAFWDLVTETARWNFTKKQFKIGNACKSSGFNFEATIFDPSEAQPKKICCFLRAPKGDCKVVVDFSEHLKQLQAKKATDVLVNNLTVQDASNTIYFQLYQTSVGRSNVNSTLELRNATFKSDATLFGRLININKMKSKPPFEKQLF